MGPTRPVAAQGLSERLEFAKCRLAQATVLDLLAPISNTENQQVSADLGWLTLIKMPPFATQLVQARVSLDELRFLRGRRRRSDGPPSHDHAA